METRQRLTLDELMETAEYQELTPKQQLFVATYVAGGIATGKYDRLDATQKAYVCKSIESARVMSYTMMGNIRVIAAINRHFNAEPIEEFLKEVNRAIRNRKLSIAQLQALKLKADLLGFSARLPGTNNVAHDKIPADVIAADKAARKKKTKRVIEKSTVVKTASTDFTSFPI